MSTQQLISSQETGKLQIKHLKRYWHKHMLKKEAKLDQGDFEDEWQTDVTLLSTLGLGLEPTLKHLYHTSPSFDEFEDWVLATVSSPDRDKINNFNKLFSKEYESSNLESIPYEVLSPHDLEFWDENGYVIIRNAVTREICDLTIEALCGYIEVDRYDASTWYKQHQSRQGIMVQLFQHPLLEQNRRSPKIRKAYEELWQRRDLWVNTDRVGFNPPQTASYKFPGPYLHWDMRNFATPVPFGLQGILYLADTAENQGAFTLVPGFQHKIDDWLVSLPKGVDPQKQDLYGLGTKSIAANAGDFIIWHHALPHGSSPNVATLPRFVQYINYVPAN